MSGAVRIVQAACVRARVAGAFPFFLRCMCVCAGGDALRRLCPVLACRLESRGRLGQRAVSACGYGEAGGSVYVLAVCTAVTCNRQQQLLLQQHGERKGGSLASVGCMRGGCHLNASGVEIPCVQPMNSTTSRQPGLGVVASLSFDLRHLAPAWCSTCLAASPVISSLSFWVHPTLPPSLNALAL